LQSAPADPATLIVAFIVFWFGGAALMSRIAGWHALSALYRAPLRLHGEELRFCTATIGATSFPITYRRCIRVLLTDKGLGLCLMFPFRFHSPPFFVPWPSVASCTEKQSLANRKVTLSFAGTNRQVTFSGPLGQVVKAKYQASTASAA
jgi:hypothetical protein